MIIALAVAALVIVLEHNLKKSLYLYSNIVILAGLLFGIGFIGNVIADIIKCEIDGTVIDAAHRLTVFLEFPRKFSYFALFVLFVVAVLLCISNIALIRHEGLRPKNILGIVISIAYIGGTYLVYFIADHMNINRHVIVFVLLIVCYMECLLASCCLLGLFAAKQKPKYDKDFIIIPGCAISKKGGLLPLLKGRTNRAVRYAWDQEIASGRPVKYVPSGGKGPDEVMSEASAMELYLLSHGAESDEVFPEKKSSTTYENFKFSKAVIESINPDANIAFATTNYHMLRCGLLAYSLGIKNIEGISSKTKWYFWPNGFVREFIAILAMNKKVHIIVAACCAVFCLAAGLSGL